MTVLPQFDDHQILARTAYGENRAGSAVGMQSVLNVIMNRSAKPSWWGRNVRDVCLKPYQFSCWLQSDPNYATITTVNENTRLFALALELAAQALSGNLPDLTSGACYYYADTMKKPPQWAEGKTPCATIAHQFFFNDVE